MLPDKGLSPYQGLLDGNAVLGLTAIPTTTHIQSSVESEKYTSFSCSHFHHGGHQITSDGEHWSTKSP